MADRTIPAFKILRGNLGVGTTLPGSLFNVYVASQRQLDFYGGTSPSGNNYVAALKLGRGKASNSALEIKYDSEGSEHAYISRLYSNAVLHFDKAGTDHMTILANGNVGIGTNAPVKKLDVRAAASWDGIHIGSTAGSATAIDFARSTTNANPTARIGVAEPAATHTSDMRFFTSDASGSAPNLVEKMRIDQNGKVGIGTNAPGSLLNVGSSASANTTIRINSSLTAGSDAAAFSFGLDNHAFDFAGMRLDYSDRVTKGLEIFTATAYGYPITITPSTNKNIILNPSGTGKVLIEGTSSYLLDVQQTAVAWTARFENNNGAYGVSIDTANNIANNVANLACYTPSGVGLFFTNQGRLAIGLTAPTAALHVSSSASVVSYIIRPSASPTVHIGSSTSAGAQLGYVHAHDYAFYGHDADYDAIVVKSTGSVGIGTTNPAADLEVLGDAIIGSAATKIKTYSDSTYSGIYNGSSLASDESIYFGAGTTYFINDGSTSLVIDSNQRVQLKGTDYQLQYVSGSHIWYTRLQSNGTFAIHKNGVGDFLSIDSAGNVALLKSGGSYLQFKDSTQVRGSINVNQGADGLVFTVGSSFSERMRTNSTGVTVGPTHGSVTFNNTSSVSASTIIQQTYNGSTAELRIGSNVSTTSTSAMNILTGNAGVVQFNGFVGVGIASPTQTFQVSANGSGSTAVDNHGYGLRVQDTNSAHGAVDILQNGDTATFVSRSNVQGGYEFKSYASVGTATHVRLKIDQSGLVGIGQSPTANFGTLQVYAAGNHTNEQNAAFTIGDNATGGMRIYGGVNNSSNYAFIGSVESGTAYRPLVLQPNGSNVGIGTVSPAQKFSVYQGRIGVTDGYNIGNMSGNTGMLVYTDSRIVFEIGGSEKMRIQASDYNLDVGGSARVQGTATLKTSGGYNLLWGKGTGWGYSPNGYRAIQIGDASGNTTVSIGYDPAGNTSGAFTGDGGELLFRNDFSFMTPNAANNGWHYCMHFQDGKVSIGSASAPAYPLHVHGNAAFSNGSIVNIGTTGSNTGKVRFYNNNSTAYYVDWKSTGARSYEFEGSSSSSDYVTSFSNADSSGGHNLNIEGMLRVKNKAGNTNRFTVSDSGVVTWGSNADSGHGQMSWDTGKAYIYGTSGNALAMGANGNGNIMHIKTNYEVHIGAGNGLQGVAIHGNTSGYGSIVGVSRDGSSYKNLEINGATVEFKAAGTVKMTVASGGVEIKGGAGGGTDLSLGGPGVTSHGTLVFNNGGGSAIGKIRTEGSDDSFYVSKLAGGGLFHFTSNNSFQFHQNMGIGTAPSHKLEVHDASSNVPVHFTSGTTSVNIKAGSNTQTQFTNLLLYTNGGNAQIWKAGGSYTAYGGANSLNIYNDTGKIAFHPAGNANKVIINTDGTLTIGAFTLPSTDGSNGQVLQTNGSGTVTWATAGGGGGITGSGTTHYIPKFTASGAVGDSTVRQRAAGGNFTGFGIDPSYPVHSSGIVCAEDGAGCFRLISTALSAKIIDLKCDNAVFKMRSVNDGREMYHAADSYHKWYISDSEKMQISSSGNVGIGTNNPIKKLTVLGDASVSGSFSASSKSFLIDHPTKENKKLEHGCLEGPEFGVYHRGRVQSSTIILPDYWSGLVGEETITVQLTPKGSFQHLYVVSQSLTEIVIGAADGETIDCFYTVYGERADIDSLVVEKEV